MTEKRLDKFDMLEFGDENEYWIIRCNKIGMANEEVVELLNLYEQLLTQEKEKNQQLKIQLSNISAQRDEFHRGARENANRVGKLKKENEQLKSKLSKEFPIQDYHSGIHLYCREMTKEELEEQNEQLKLKTSIIKMQKE